MVFYCQGTRVVSQERRNIMNEKLPRNLPSRKRLMRQMAALALDGEQKTADRIRALTLLTDFMEKEGAKEESLEKLDRLLELLG